MNPTKLFQHLGCNTRTQIQTAYYHQHTLNANLCKQLKAPRWIQLPYLILEDLAVNVQQLPTLHTRPAWPSTDEQSPVSILKHLPRVNADPHLHCQSSAFNNCLLDSCLCTAQQQILSRLLHTQAGLLDNFLHIVQ